MFVTTFFNSCFCTKMFSVLWLLTLISFSTSISQETDSDQTEEATAIIAQVEQIQWGKTETTEWVSLLKKLVELGPAAVEPTCDALRATKDDFQIRFYGFALRAIGDPRAVHVLIESIPKTLRPPGSDYGLKVDDESLMEFMHVNDLESEDEFKSESFGFGRPFREVNGAIKALAKHDLAGDEIGSVFLSGGELQLYLKHKLYFDHTVKWRKWWGRNYLSRGVEMDHVDVDLANFDISKPEVVNDFKNPNASTGSHSTGNFLEEYKGATHAAFYDLDTGRRCKLPSSMSDKSKDELAIWARAEGFDLMGIELPDIAIIINNSEKEDKKTNAQPAYAIFPLGLKAWQNEAKRFEAIDEEIGDPNIQMGTPAHEYLLYFNAKRSTYEPSRPVTFLFQTAEGTCGAIEVVSQVTELFTQEDMGKSSRELSKNKGFAFGVKFNLKTIAEH